MSRRKTQSAFYLPKIPATRTPRLDHFLRTEVTPQARTLDKDLLKIQTFVFDVLAPLMALLETNEDELTPAHLQTATTSAVQLLRNANVHISRLRREKIITWVNKALIPLVKDDAPYTDAAPDLFGSEFSKRSKEFLKQVKTIRSSLPTKQRQKGGLFFGRANPWGGQGPTNEAEPPITTGAAETGKPETTRSNRHCITNSCYQCFKNIPLSMVKSMGINPLGLTVSTAGRLALFACNWGKLTKDQWVLSTI